MSESNLVHGIRKVLGTDSLLYKWTTESQSWQSDTMVSRYWMPHVRTSREALMALFLSTFRPYWETQEIFERIGSLAYQYRYSGQWELVQWMIEQENPTVLDERIWLLIFPPSEFYGNFLRDCEIYLLKNNHRKAFKSYEQRGRVTARVRRRGYQDKGSLCPDYKKGRRLPDPDPGPDRRRLNRHPLLLDAEDDDKAREGVWRTTTSLDQLITEVRFNGTSN